MTDHTDRIVKYGLSASETHKPVERHFEVTTGRLAIADAHFVHALREGPKLAAALERIKNRDR